MKACLGVLCELLYRSDSKLRLSFGSAGVGHDSLFTILASAIHEHVDDTVICDHGCKIFLALATESSNLSKLAAATGSKGGSLRGAAIATAVHDSIVDVAYSLAADAASSGDCSAVIVLMLLTHFRLELSDTADDLHGELILDILHLISDLCSRSSPLQFRLGHTGACQVILSTVNFHKNNKRIVIGASTALSNLAATASPRFEQK